ncbi:MAG: aldo/keto reductase [Promethearchaeota archaeon]
MRYVELGKTGEKIAVLGQGLWGISRLKGFFKSQNYYENIKSALRYGIELGMTHIDTAEFYGMGKAEKVLGEIIKEYDRDDLFITSKLFPIHFRKKTMKKAANKSLKRLGINYLDLYLIHWPSKFISIAKEMNVLETLVKEGKTRYIGVSNFSVKQFKKAQESLKKEELVNNQLHINITNQKHIHNSLSYYQRNGVTVTAYSPLGHNGYTRLRGKIREELEKIAIKYNATIQQIAIAWLINHDNIIAIPKAFNRDHVEENAKAAEISLLKEYLQRIYKFGEFR